MFFAHGDLKEKGRNEVIRNACVLSRIDKAFHDLGVELDNRVVYPSGKCTMAGTG
jgi:hypothetical protein